MKKLDRVYQSIPDEVERMKYIVKEHSCCYCGCQWNLIQDKISGGVIKFPRSHLRETAMGKALHNGKLCTRERHPCTREASLCTRENAVHTILHTILRTVLHSSPCIIIMWIDSPTLHTTTFKHVHTVSLHTNLDRSCENCAKIVAYINSSVGRWIASHSLPENLHIRKPSS